jgi:hypothetical protein
VADKPNEQGDGAGRLQNCDRDGEIDPKL